jgi:hypothetical protein
VHELDRGGVTHREGQRHGLLEVAFLTTDGRGHRHGQVARVGEHGLGLRDERARQPQRCFELATVAVRLVPEAGGVGLLRDDVSGFEMGAQLREHLLVSLERRLELAEEVLVDLTLCETIGLAHGDALGVGLGVVRHLGAEEEPLRIEVRHVQVLERV